MGCNERREWIKKKIEIDKKIEISALSKELNVSEMTIRRDVEYLEKEGILTKVSKGAILNSVRNKDDIDDTLNSRNLQNVQEKKIIARYASGLIEDGDVIFMDASTTVYELCPYIIDKKLTIITNSIRVAQYFNMSKNITLILAGGILRYATLSLIGADVEQLLSKYNTNKIFISAKALCHDNGLTDINMFEIDTKKAAMKNTHEVIVLLDHTKINKTSLTKVCDIKDISKIIIDEESNLSDEQRKDLKLIKEENIEIIFAK